MRLWALSLENYSAQKSSTQRLNLVLRVFFVPDYWCAFNGLIPIGGEFLEKVVGM